VASEDTKEKQGIEKMSVNFTLMHPIAAVLQGIARLCHGPQTVDIPDERLEMRNLTLTFNCSWGHIHKMEFVNRGSGAASFIGNIIELATAERAKAQAPLLVAPDGRPVSSEL